MRNVTVRRICFDCERTLSFRRRRDPPGSGYTWVAPKHKTTRTREAFWKGKFECPGSGKPVRGP